MFEIVFLGTSASAPSVYRGLPAQIVLAGEHRFLVDCGEGTQRQILRSGIGFKRLNKILLTHNHLDHILGLGGLVSTFAHWESIESLEIWGGKTTLDRVQALLYGVVLDYERVPIDIRLQELKAGQLMQAKDFAVNVFPVTHRGSGNFGFIFQEKSRRPFLLEKAEALGVPAGPERSQLVKGEALTLRDGRIIQPDDVLGEWIHGVKFVHIGDTARTDNLVEHVTDADVLVIEATFLDENVEEARAFGHITAREAAQLALESRVKSLVLTHVSRRYRERDVLEEARRIFPQTNVARDLDHYIIRRDQSLEKKITEASQDEA
jgi:ribonuclease Z